MIDKILNGAKPVNIEELIKQIDSGDFDKGYVISQLRAYEKYVTMVEEYAIRDSLTGIFNKGYFVSALYQQLAFAARYKKPVSLLMLDADDFTQVNNTYGHGTGDKFLRGLARKIAYECGLRQSDIFARYGGEEFGLILPNTDRKGAETVALKLIGPWEIDTGVKISKTLSIGVNTVYPERSLVFGLPQLDDEGEIVRHSFLETVIERADKALYTSKFEGKQRFTSWDEHTDTRFNRYSFVKTLYDSLFESAKEGKPISVILLSMSYFENFPSYSEIYSNQCPCIGVLNKTLRKSSIGFTDILSDEGVTSTVRTYNNNVIGIVLPMVDGEQANRIAESFAGPKLIYVGDQIESTDITAGVYTLGDLSQINLSKDQNIKRNLILPGSRNNGLGIVEGSVVEHIVKNSYEALDNAKKYGRNVCALQD